MVLKKYVKKQQKRFGRWTKQRYGTWSKPKLNNVIKDVMMLKNVINAEKKRIVIPSWNQTVGQVNGNNSGQYITDITPVATVGTGFSQRNGASLKLHSSYLNIQLNQQDACIAPIRVKIMICQTVGKTQTNLSNYLTEILQPNPFVNGLNVYDTTSMFNPDNYGTFKILRTQWCYLPVDSITGQKQVKPCVLKFKYNKGKGHHIRYDKDTNTVTDGQIFMILLADNGNAGVSNNTNATTGVNQTQLNSGILFHWHLTHYYYDN